mmetsp:Transcript_75011/g.206906  ORF Transcript_75011/g.206906 Transcript_75011/m.206906 type:complete len:146 (-) Transcript_75011:743-1180(-)
MCALAVLGGRFAGVEVALKHPDFAGVATEYYTRKAYGAMKQQPDAVRAAKAAEDHRLAEVERLAAAERCELLDLQRCDDPEYVSEMFRSKLCVAAEAGTQLSKAEVQSWAALFEQVDAATRRDMAYRFQYCRPGLPHGPPTCGAQ